MYPLREEDGTRLLMLPGRMLRLVYRMAYSERLLPPAEARQPNFHQHLDSATLTVRGNWLASFCGFCATNLACVVA